MFHTHAPRTNGQHTIAKSVSAGFEPPVTLDKNVGGFPPTELHPATALNVGQPLASHWPIVGQSLVNRWLFIGYSQGRDDTN